jgi:hypothetical protein
VLALAPAASAAQAPAPLPQAFQPVAAADVYTPPSFRFYSQQDERWARRPFAAGDMSSSGCGPTALAMVVASLGRPWIDPWDVARRFREDSSYYGTIWTGAKSMPMDVGRHYGLHPRWVRRNMKEVKNALRRGALVVGIFQPGRFTDIGHFLVLHSIHDGAIELADPAGGRYDGWYRPAVLLGPGNASGFWTFER